MIPRGSSREPGEEPEGRQEQGPPLTLLHLPGPPGLPFGSEPPEIHLVIPAHQAILILKPLDECHHLFQGICRGARCPAASLTLRPASAITLQSQLISALGNEPGGPRRTQEFVTIQEDPGKLTGIWE